MWHENKLLLMKIIAKKKGLFKYIFKKKTSIKTFSSKLFLYGAMCYLN